MDDFIIHNGIIGCEIDIKVSNNFAFAGKDYPLAGYVFTGGISFLQSYHLAGWLYSSSVTGFDQTTFPLLILGLMAMWVSELSGAAPCHLKYGRNYYDPQHLTRLFKNRVGHSPNEYRSQN